MLQLPCRLPVTSTLRVKIRLCQKCLPWKASRRGQFDLPEGFHLEPLFFDTTTAYGLFLIAIGKRNVAQRLRCEHKCLMERPRTLSPHKNGAARTPASRPVPLAITPPCRPAPLPYFPNSVPSRPRRLGFSSRQEPSAVAATCRGCSPPPRRTIWYRNGDLTYLTSMGVACTVLSPDR